MDPFEVLPEEVWRKIFGYLQHGKDQSAIVACFYTNSTFRPLLQVKLYAEVLLVAETYLRETYKNDKGFLGVTDFKRMRSVCKLWKQSVETFLQFHVFHHQATDRLDNIFSKFYPTTHISSWNLRRVDDIIQQSIRFYYRSKDGHPFPSRHLKIVLKGNNNLNDTIKLEKSILELLDIFGSQVYYFSVVLPAGTWSSYLYGWLKRMPNLKMICVRIERISEELRTPKQAIVQAEHYFKNQQMPDMRALQTVTINGATCTLVSK